MFARPQARRKLLRQDKGRPQIRIQVPVPALAGRGIDAVVFKDRRAIDENTNGTDGSLGVADDALHVRLYGKVRTQQAASASHALDIRLQSARVVLARQVVGSNIPPLAGKPERYLAAKAPRRTRDQSCSHGRIGRTGPLFGPGPAKRPAHRDAESSCAAASTRATPKRFTSESNADTRRIRVHAA
jgi:hypothetical protein